MNSVNAWETIKSRPPGLAVVGGLIVSQALTLFITPVIYLYLDKFSAALTPSEAKEEAETAGERDKELGGHHAPEAGL